MIYNFEDRINRVINNHQFTCQHRSHYLFVLKGFEPIIDFITLNVAKYASEQLSTQTNYWMTFEESNTLNADDWSLLREFGYDIWIVEFNFFTDKYIAMVDSSSHKNSEKKDGILWVDYHDNENIESRKTLSIFNTNNPLIGVLNDSKQIVSNSERWEIIKASLSREAK